MSGSALLCRAALIISVAMAMPAGAQQSAIPNFTSPNFGWLGNTGFDYLPVEGTVAPIGADPNWRGGIGLPAAGFKYQPPEAATDPRRQGASPIGPWNNGRPFRAREPHS